MNYRYQLIFSDWSWLQIAIALCVVCASPGAVAQNMAFTGTTGSLSTPDATIAAPGTFTYQYNNFMEDRFEEQYRGGNNHVFTLGVFSRFEMAGRLTDFEPVGEKYGRLGTLRGKRDLSANIKINLLRPSESWWFSIGATDFAGLAQNFTSFYAVGSARWRNALFSLGFAGGDNASFDGVFANASYQVNQYVSVAAEVDTDSQLSAGIVATLPVTRNVALSATLSGGGSDARLSLAARVGLGSRPVVSGSSMTDEPGAGSTVSSDSRVVQENDTGTIGSEPLERLADNLTQAGFQRVRMGQRSEYYMLVEMENRLFAHTDYDAISRIVEEAREILPLSTTLEVILLNQGLPKFRAAIPLDNSANVVLPIAANPSERNDVSWLVSGGSNNRSYVDLFVEPALHSSVGTEFGIIDFSLAAKVGASVPLWRGARAVFSAYLPVANTRNYKSGEPYSRFAFNTSTDRALFEQYFPVFKRVHTQVELGQIQVRGFHYTAAKLQGTWQSGQLPVRLHVRAGQYGLIDSSVKRNVYLGTATYTLPKWDSTLSATYGQFFFNERAVKLTATRRFGNVHISLFTKVISKDDLAGGLQFSTPIGPRKGGQWKGVTLNGSSRWSHALQTTIKYPDASDNRLQPAFLFEPLSDSEIPQRMLDSGRLNAFDFN